MESDDLHDVAHHLHHGDTERAVASLLKHVVVLTLEVIDLKEKARRRLPRPPERPE